jgi:hypothetical protein
MNITLFSDTGKRLASIGGVSCFNAWECLQASVAARFEVPVDAVSMLEDEDGIEVVTVDGKRVGYVVTEINGHIFGAPASNDNADEFTAIQSAVADLMSAAE